MSKSKSKSKSHSKSHPKHGHGHKAHAPQGSAQPPEGHVHDDDLIVVPRGTSRLKFFLTLSLTIFVLLIFTVGGLFQASVGGLFGGGGQARVALAWTNPLTGERHEMDEMQFRLQGQILDEFNGLGLFMPRHADPSETRRPRVSPEDVALYVVLEDLAQSAGIEISTEEFRQYLLQTFRTAQNVAMVAAQRRMRRDVPALEEDLRAMLRADKVMELLRMGAGQVDRFGRFTGAVDAASVREAWDEQHQQFAFQVVELAGEDFEEAARGEAPSDEELLEWFHALPTWRQQQHHTEERFVPEVAWVPLGDAFDATALLERYPPAEGLDEEAAAKSYYNRFNNVRFKNEVPDDATDEGAPEDDTSDEDAAGEDAADEDAADEDAGGEDAGGEDAADEDASGEDAGGEDAADENAGGEDAGDQVAADPDAGDQAGADAGDQGDPDGAADEDADASDDQDDDEPSQDEEPPLYKPYEEVADLCRVEAPIHAALVAWHADLRQRMNAPDGEPVDFVVEATELGLTIEQPTEAMTRTAIEEAPGWGGPFVANQFTFAQEGALLPSVVVESGAMLVVRLAGKEPRSEPPFEEIRDAVLDEWAKERATDLAVERLEAVRDALGERPAEDAEEAEEGDEGDEGEDEVAATEEAASTTEGAGDEEQSPWMPVATAEAFRTAAEAAGFTVVDRPWLEQFAVPDDDFEAASESDRHIRVTRPWFELEEGQVPAAQANAAKTHAILVRFGGKRAKPFDEAKAKDIMTLRRTAMMQEVQAFDERAFRATSPWFQETFDLVIAREEPKEAPEEAPEEETPPAR